MTLPRIAILGAGRAGCSLFKALGRSDTLLWTRSAATAEAARREGFPVVSGPLPDLSGIGLVLLAVSDGAVSVTASRLPADTTVAHLSGALDLDVLGARPSAGSLHPLVSMATRRTPLRGAAAAVAATTPSLDATLTELAEALGLFVIHPMGDRARYHAAASIVGNFPQVLLEAASRLLVTMGLSADEARRALGPLLEGAARNAAALGPMAGLTGPIVRGDVEVVRRHFNAIGGSPETEALYRAASRIAMELARRRGVDVSALEGLFQDAKG